MVTQSRPGGLNANKNVKRTRASGAIAENSNSPTAFSWVDTVTRGDNISGWRQRLRDGLSATTSLSGSEVEAKYTPGYGRFELVKNGLSTQIYLSEVTGSNGVSLAIPSDPSSISDAKSNSEAMGRFLRSARKVETAFQGGVFLGELGQTLSMIRNPLKSFRDLVDDGFDLLRKVRTKGAKNRLSLTRVTKQLGDQWLEIQFGWKPLQRDIFDACDALKKDFPTGTVSVRRITGTYEDKGVGTTSTTSGANSPAFWQIDTHSETTCMVIYRGAMRVSAINPLHANMQLLGFNLSNFAPTVWELIPYSFLIDYFSNVGDVVEGWSQLGTRLAWCNRTVRKTRSTISESYSSMAYASFWNSQNGNTLASMSFSPTKSVISRKSVTRGEYTGAMVPPLTWRLPGFGSLRWLNLAALVASRDNDRKWLYD